MEPGSRGRVPALEPAFVAAFLLVAAASLVPIWSVGYLPMVDLPQHAAQVFIWRHHGDPAFPEIAETYRIRYLVPYFFGYFLTRVLAAVMPVALAVKVVVSLAVVALPASLAGLLRRCGSDAWWSLLGFPLAYGFAFYWGLLNYMVAVPLGIAFLAAGIAYARNPSLRRGLLMTAFGVVLYFSHALVLVLVLPLAALLVLVEAGEERWSVRGLARLLPFVPPPIAAVAWAASVRQGQGGVEDLWTETTVERLGMLPQMLVGTGWAAGLWTAGGLVILLLPLAFGTLRRRPAWLLLPLLSAFALYLAAPTRGLGAWHVNQRYALFVGAFLPLLIAPAASAWRRRLGRGVLVVFLLAWTVWLVRSFEDVDPENRRLASVLDAVPEHASILGLVFDPGFGVLQGAPIFYHSHVWHQVERGGIAESSFASSYPSLARYREGVEPRSRRILNREPFRFDPHKDGPFDYYLVRVDRDLAAELFRDLPVELVAHEGMWWLYRRSG